ncbi:MAG: substrate-binding domain-containing protein [Candidatus Sumerlaeota bacterium]|nr:substrate-binding domain-containing protein [Candidatus Sumerlaeota bacterium]
MKYAGDRTTNWTRDAISTCDNYDALVVHLYVWVGLEPQAPKNEKKPTAEERARQQADFDKPDGPARVIGQPLLAWRDLRRNNDVPPNADLWATEFGERDFIGATNGTWALTLFTVNQIHAFLDDGRVSRFCCQLLQNLAVPDGEGEGEAAMREAGLSVHTDSVHRSKTMDPQDLNAVRQFLLDYAHATAVVTIGAGLGHDIVSVADLIGIRIPEDLSIVGSARRRHGPVPPQFFTRFDFNQNAVLNACFELLQEQISTRHCRLSQVLIRPHIVDGDTVAPPRKKQMDERSES